MIVDDHGLVRAGLEQLLGNAEDIDVVAAAAGGRQAVEMVEAARPDVVLMDLSMPGRRRHRGDARGRLAARPAANVVVLTSFSDRERILDALGAGAIGYLLKDSEPEELLQGIRAAARGESPLAPKAAQRMLAARATSSRARRS